MTQCRRRRTRQAKAKEFPVAENQQNSSEKQDKNSVEVILQWEREYGKLSTVSKLYVETGHLSQELKSSCKLLL